MVLSWLCFVVPVSAPMAAEPAIVGDEKEEYVCDGDECEAAPLSQDGKDDVDDSPYKRFLDSRPDFVTKPVTLLESLLSNRYETKIFGRILTAGISGRISRAFLYGDNQEDQEVFFVDNNNSATQIVGTADMGLSDNWRTGGRIKIPIIVRSSVEVDFGDDHFDFSFGDFGEKELSGYLTHKKYGKFSFGYGSTASDGTSESDLSGMTVISRSRVRDLAGGLSFTDGGPQIKQVFANFDGLGDALRFRYDSPRFSNVSLSTSLTTDDDIDIAVRWEKRFDTQRLAAAASFVERGNGVEQVSISGSALWESGFNITGVVAGQRAGNHEPFLLYGKVGWLGAPFDIGPTAYGFDAAYNKSVLQSGDEATTIGAFLVQTINRDGIFHAIDLYAGVRLHHLETNSKKYDDIFATMVGARFRF